MDSSRSGAVNFEDFLSWYTLAHSKAGMLSKKGQAYTGRFKKIMAKLGGAFDTKNLTCTTSGPAASLEYRVQFHYNDHGQLKQISPWHDIPLYAPDGNVHMVVEIPKFSRAKFEIATGEDHNPIKQDTKNGKLREYKYGDMLFNYGCFPQTWEDPAHVTPDTGFGGDNDPVRTLPPFLFCFLPTADGVAGLLPDAQAMSTPANLRGRLSNCIEVGFLAPTAPPK